MHTCILVSYVLSLMRYLLFRAFDNLNFFVRFNDVPD